MKQSADTREIDEGPGTPTPEEVMGKVRALVGALLKAGAEAPQISYSLAYVATEFGLAVAANPVRIVPVVLGAVSRAAANHKQEGNESQEGCSESDIGDDDAPEGATLH